MFRLILLLLVVGLVAVAFYLGWVHISGNNSEDQSNITLSINKGKVKESVGALREKIGGNSEKPEGKTEKLEGKSEKPEGKAENPKKIKETTVSGKVEAIGSGEIKVKNDSDQVLTVVIAKETQMQGQPKRGDAVTVTYITTDNRNVATSIRKD